MIPKTIHYCWFGKNDMPPLIKVCIKTWDTHLSEYKIVRWDESNYPKNSFTDYHLKKGNWAFVSDYVRLYALYTEGGVYLDTDFEVIKPFDDLLDSQGFLAYQDNIYINNAIAGSIKGNMFFKDCMKHMENLFDNEFRFEISPVVTTKILETKNYDIKVYESEYFYPYNPYDDKKIVKQFMYDMVTDNTYAIHHWGKSWSIEKKEDRSAINLLLDVSPKRMYFSIKSLLFNK